MIIKRLDKIWATFTVTYNAQDILDGVSSNCGQQ